MDPLHSMPTTTKDFPSPTHFTGPKSGPTSLPVSNPTGTQAEGEKQFRSLVPPKLGTHLEKRSASVPDDKSLQKPQGKVINTVNYTSHVLPWTRHY